MKIQHLYCFLFLLLSSSAFSQPNTLLLSGQGKDSFQAYLPKQLNFPDIYQVETTLRPIVTQFIDKGYLTASIDSIQFIDSTVIAFVFLGNLYRWAHLTNKNIPNDLLQLAHLREKDFLGKRVDVPKLIPYYEKILSYCEDNGFPFAYLQLDSVRENNGEISAQLNLTKGPFIKLDSITINEDARITRNYVLRYLGIHQGMIYQESKIKLLSNRIQELSFLQENYPWKLIFTSAKTTLNLYLKNKSANRADVLIGLQPNAQEIGRKFMLTGDVKLAFINALGQGESLQLNWQNLQFQSPRYNFHAQYPYVLNTPIGISARFDFYKKDTTFKTVNGELGAFYQLNANDQIKLYYEVASNRLSSVNISNLQYTRKLPDNADVTYRTVGVEALHQRVDYKLNPRKGYRLFINAGLSFRKLIRNSQVEQTIDPILNIPFSYLYDSVQLASYKYNLRLQVSGYLPLKKRIVFYENYQGGITLSNNNLFRNELYQIGGYRLLRGFDEGSLYVNQYHVFTFEPRYLISRNSYFFLFSDLGIIQSKFATTFIKDSPYSFGLGMTFETKAGLFNISYALGGRNQQGIEFKNAKIHFGYINYF